MGVDTGVGGNSRGSRDSSNRGKKGAENPRPENVQEDLLDDGFPLRNLDLKAIAVTENGSSTNNLLFHPYEPLLMVADDADNIWAFNHKESIRYAYLGPCELRGVVRESA